MGEPDVFRVVAALKDLSTFRAALGDDGVKVCTDALDFINHAVEIANKQAARIAALEAEVERLRPKEMTLLECWKYLNKIGYRGQKWIISERDPGCDIVWNSIGESMSKFEVEAIVEKSLRERDPSHA